MLCSVEKQKCSAPDKVDSLNSCNLRTCEELTLLIEAALDTVLLEQMEKTAQELDRMAEALRSQESSLSRTDRP